MGVEFARTGLQPIDGIQAVEAWRGPAGELVSLHAFAVPPDLPAELDGPGVVRFYRRLAHDAGMGLVEASLVPVAGIVGTQAIVKAVLDPETRRGRGYVGSITVPYRDRSYVVKVQAAEGSPTGQREALAMATLSARGELGAAQGGPPAGWLDPVDPAPPHLARNVSEDARFDDLVEGHPLSVVRAWLDRIRPTLRVSSDAAGAAPLYGP